MDMTMPMLPDMDALRVSSVICITYGFGSVNKYNSRTWALASKPEILVC